MSVPLDMPDVTRDEIAGGDEPSARTIHRRVLVIIQGDLGDRPLGPEIRGLEIARAFAARHHVTIAASTKAPFEHDGLQVVPRSRGSLWREIRRHDVVVGPVLPPHLMSRLASRRCIRVADLYDPVELEHSTVEDNDHEVRLQRSLRRLQLRWSDIIISANERQQQLARAEIAGVGRCDGTPLLVKVPMGLPDAPAPSSRRPLRDRFGIGRHDPVVLWWGTAWRWLDAEGAVRAVADLARRMPEVRLVITAGKPRNRGSDPLNRTGEARELARSLGVLDRNVLFLDDWVALEERHHYLADADLGITLHTASPEAEVAARTRYMDYLWASLPCVLSEGDELANEMAAAGAARLVAPHDYVGAAAALEALLADRAALERARKACRIVAERYRWSTAVAPLIDAVEQYEPSGGSIAATLCNSAAYYAQRSSYAVIDARALLAESRRRREAGRRDRRA